MQDIFYYVINIILLKLHGQKEHNTNYLIFFSTGKCIDT